ncbi:MAG: FtsX-like permease family protein [Lachnospiraceae bacterium]|nr:FtsX-like permease family protein [Lachnospiraceae bacterium]
MRFNQKIGLAYYNLTHKAKYSVKMISSIMLIMIIMLYSLLLLLGIERYYEKLVVDNAKENNIYLELELDGGIRADDRKLLEQIQELDGVGQPILYAAMDLPKLTGNESEWYLMSDRATISYGDNKDVLRCVKSDVLDVLYLGNEGSYFMESDKDYFAYYYEGENLVLTGTDAQKSGDVVVSDVFLEQFGVGEYDTLIGERISLYIDDNLFLDEARLVGVYDSRVSELAGMKYCSPVIYCGEQGETDSLMIKEMSVCIPVIGWENAEDINQSLETIDGNQKTFFDEYSAQILVYVNRIKQLVYYIVLLIMIFVIVAMFLSLCGVLVNRIQENTSYYAMMRAVGLKSRDLLGLLHMEQLLLLLCAVFFTMPFAFLGLLLVNYLLQNVLQAEIMLSLVDFVRIDLGCIGVVYLGLIFVTGLFSLRSQRQQISVLLKK